MAMKHKVWGRGVILVSVLPVAFFTHSGLAAHFQGISKEGDLEY